MNCIQQKDCIIEWTTHSKNDKLKIWLCPGGLIFVTDVLVIIVTTTQLAVLLLVAGLPLNTLLVHHLIWAMKWTSKLVGFCGFSLGMYTDA